MKPTIKTFADNPAVANAFAADFVEILKLLSSAQSKVTVALSGGSTPKLLFSVLAESYCEAVDWSKIHFFWGDERCVPPSDPESNFGEADKLLLSRIKIPAENIHRVRGEDDPQLECTRYRQAILESVSLDKNQTPAFDVMLLGMGSDGHTASIFPEEIELWKSNQICEVATHPQSGQKRITVTGKIINASRQVIFLITGAAKADVLAEIMNQTGNYDAYPTSLVSPAGGYTLYLDQAAAAKL